MVEDDVVEVKMVFVVDYTELIGTTKVAHSVEMPRGKVVKKKPLNPHRSMIRLVRPNRLALDLGLGCPKCGTHDISLAALNELTTLVKDATGTTVDVTDLD